MRRRALLLAAAALASPLARAQTARRKFRIGFINAPDERLPRALIEGLRERGYREGIDYELQVREDGGDASRFAALSKEIVASRPDVIVTVAAPRVEAVARETRSIPIVFASVGDAVEQGFARSLGAPGGNMTGISTQNAEVFQKLFELARDMLPAPRHLCVMVDEEHAAYGLYQRDLPRIARKAGVRHTLVGFKRAATLESLFAEIAAQRPDAVIAAPATRLYALRAKLAGLALNARLPLFATFPPYAEAGCLATYGANLAEQFRRAAYFVDRILRGAKPGEIPIEQPTKFELVVNLKTARALGLSIAQTLLMRADRVIE